MPKDYDFVSGLLDEIALEGLDGITLEMLWQRIRDRPNFSIPVDEYSKIFFWKIVAMHKDLEIYELPKPRKFYPIYNRYDHIDPELGVVVEPEKLDPDPYAPVVPIEDEKVQGSCSTYYERKCITSQIRCNNVLLVPLKEAEDTWGDSLVLVGSPKLRLLSLIGTVTNPLIDLSLEVYCVLELIGRSRYLGAVTQGEEGLLKLIGSFCTDMDNKVKYMTSYRLIKSQNEFIKSIEGRICTTSLYHLSRFYEERDTKMKSLMNKLCEILEVKPQRQEYYTVLQGEMKISGENLKLLINGPLENCVEIITQEFCREEKTCRLIKHCKEIKYAKDEDRKAGELQPNIHFDSSKIYYGMPLVHQVYNHIKEAGRGGMSVEDLGRTMTLPSTDIHSLISTLSEKGHIIELQDTGIPKDKKYIASINAKEDAVYRNLEEKENLKAEKRKDVDSGSEKSGKHPRNA